MTAPRKPPTMTAPTYDHLRKLYRRIAVLERALAPFAKEADQWADKVGPRYRPGLTEPRKRHSYAKAEFNLGHLRRARRLLKGAT